MMLRRLGLCPNLVPRAQLSLFLVLVSTISSTCQSPRSKEERVHHEAGPSPELSPAFSREREAVTAGLLRSVGAWTRSDKARMITSRNIFDYMDGAGELYIGYGFRLLDVYDYSSANQDDILVEIYWMETSDDAFGLLSNDWAGDAVTLGPPESEESKNTIAPRTRALYGAGLLRICSDNLYARIMAYRVSEASRGAVLDIGRSIVAGRKNSPEPALLKHLPTEVQGSFRLRPDRLCYFRSHLVLNSVYFLSTGNILNLGPKAKAVTVSYEKLAGGGKSTSFRALLIRYSGESEAREALRHFLEIYVPEKAKGAAKKTSGDDGILKIEDGWMGYQLKEALLCLVFECPSAEVARSFLNQALRNAGKTEDVHE